MDIDFTSVSVGWGLLAFPVGVLKRIISGLETMDVAYLAMTLDKGLIAAINEGRMIEEFALSIPRGSPRQLGNLQFLLSQLTSLRKLVSRENGSTIMLTSSVISHLYRLDLWHVTFIHQPEVSSAAPLHYLSKSKKMLNMGAMFPHLKSLELQGGWDAPAAVLDLVRSLPRSFQTLKIDWPHKSFQAIMLVKVFDNLPPSTTAIHVFQRVPSARARIKPDPCSFYAFQTRLPELTTLTLPFDVAIFDPPNRAPNAMPPQLWTTSLTSISLRTEELSPFHSYAFPASLRSFNLLVSTKSESVSNNDLGHSQEFLIILQSLPITLQELSIRNPAGKTPAFDFGPVLPPGLTRLLIHPSWVTLFDIPKRMPQLINLQGIYDSLPRFEETESESVLPSPPSLRTAPYTLFSLPLPSFLNTIDWASTTLCLDNIPLLPPTVTKIRISANSLATCLAIPRQCPKAIVSIVNEVTIDEDIFTDEEFSAEYLSRFLFASARGRLTIHGIRMHPKFNFRTTLRALDLRATNVRSAGAYLHLPLFSPSELKRMSSLTKLVLQHRAEITDSFWRTLPKTLKILDLGKSHLSIEATPLDVSSVLPAELEEFTCDSHVDRNKLKWASSHALPAKLRKMDTPSWIVDVKWTKRLPPTITFLSVTVDKMSDFEVIKFLAPVPQITHLFLRLQTTFLYSGALLPDGPNRITLDTLVSCFVAGVLKASPHLKFHNLDLLIYKRGHLHVRDESVRWRPTSFPASYNTYVVDGPAFYDIFQGTPLPPRWKMDYLLEDESELKYLVPRDFRGLSLTFKRLVRPPHASAAASGSGGKVGTGGALVPASSSTSMTPDPLHPTSSEHGNGGNGASNGASSKLAPSPSLTPRSASRHQTASTVREFDFGRTFSQLVTLRINCRNHVPSSFKVLEFHNMPPRLTNLRVPEFKIPPPPKMPFLSLTKLEFAGGHSWNEVNLQELCTKNTSLNSIHIRKMVINGTLLPQQVKTVTWNALTDYCRTTIPNVRLDGAAIRFRAKLPDHILSIDLSPRISLGWTTSTKTAKDLPEWHLAQVLPRLPTSLTAIHLTSDLMRIFGDEFLVLMAPTLLRLNVRCKCILNNDWLTHLPPIIQFVNLPSAVCRKAAEPLAMADFKQSLKLIQLPLMLIHPPVSPSDIPSGLMQLTMARAWPAGYYSSIQKHLAPNLKFSSADQSKAPTPSQPLASTN